MKESLKEKLYNEIKSAYPYEVKKDRLKQICESSGYNWADNGTSRLRELSRGVHRKVQRIHNEKGILTGFIYIQQIQPVKHIPDNATQGQLFKTSVMF